MKPQIQEVIIVEGRYDKNALLQVVDATVFETSGFGIFRNKEKAAFFRRLAAQRGLLILTDSDGAGFVIRNYLKKIIPPSQLKQAYIPDIAGKEKRKKVGGKEGKLGVEGMKPEILLESLRKAGATFGEETDTPRQRTPLTKTDLFLAGLSGGAGSGEKRKQLLQFLHLPEHLTANALLDTLNLLYSAEEFPKLLQEAGISEENRCNGQ